MALPTGVLSSCTMCVELSTDGTTWIDFSDYLTVLEPGAVQQPAHRAETGRAHRNFTLLTLRIPDRERHRTAGNSVQDPGQVHRGRDTVTIDPGEDLSRRGVPYESASGGRSDGLAVEDHRVPRASAATSRSSKGNFAAPIC